MNTTGNDETRPAAVVAAEDASTRWADAAWSQRSATPDHADFYALAGELVATLHRMQDLTAVLGRQVAGYAEGRAVYDDSYEIDPRERLADAVADLALIREALELAYRQSNRFWSTIGHIGIDASDSGGSSR